MSGTPFRSAYGRAPFFIAALLAASPVAASTFTAVAITGSGEIQQQNNSGATAYSSNLENEATEFAAAGAGPGELRASAVGSISASGTDEYRSVGAGGEARAGMYLTDVLLSGPGASVVTSYNLHFSGYTTVECNNDGTTANASFSFQSVLGAAGVANAAINMGGAIYRSCQYVDYSGIFFSTGFDGNETLTSASRSMPTGVPIYLNAEIRVGGGSAGYLGAGADTVDGKGLVDFSSTVSFPTDGPVFNLPEGYTANSLDGMIVDNRWTPVPVGPAGAFLGTGLLALLPRLRRRRPDG